MFKHILKNQEGVQMFASIALVMFVIIFVVAVFMFFLKGKNHTDHMANLPLED